MKVTVAQSMGSSFLLPIAQTVFQNKLLQYLKELAPDVDPRLVFSAGSSSEAIQQFPAQVVGGIVRSYEKALRLTFAIGIPFAIVALIVSFFMPWFKYHQAEKQGVENTVDRGKEDEQEPELDRKNLSLS